MNNHKLFTCGSISKQESYVLALVIVDSVCEFFLASWSEPLCVRCYDM